MMLNTNINIYKKKNYAIIKLAFNTKRKLDIK